ncbi:MAG: squalene synthase HpnC [Pseudonocardiales bacterium]|nr:squalene synthase HpnC [Pseudonocardiales bacterium]
MAAISDGPVAPQYPPEQVLEHKRRAENFPVALRLLPRTLRADLIAVYGVVRVIDDLGDCAPGDRTALLEAFRADLASVWETGRPQHPVLQQLVPTVAARGLGREPFDRVVRANLLDQRVHRYATYSQLRDYCTLSADPIGRIVLALFGVGDPVAIELSDRVCTALQLIEHWQDIAEDRRAGRVYLPQEDLAAYRVVEADLDALPGEGVSSPALRALMAFEITRAAELLDSGAPLVRMLHGWARLAVAGYVAGGRAAVDALRRSVSGRAADILTGPPRPRRRDVLRHLLGALHEPPTRRGAVSDAHQPASGEVQ